MRHAGLHPGNPPASGRAGTPEIGLELNGPIEDAVRIIEARGISFQSVADQGKAGKFAHFLDPDGNRLYLAELNWKHVDGGEGNYPRKPNPTA